MASSIIKAIVRSISKSCQPLFSLQIEGAKEKAIKKETPWLISPSADGEEGFAPSTAQAFEKA